MKFKEIKRKFPMGMQRWWHWQVEQRWCMSRLNSKSIRPGDIYENCNYHPMACVENNYGELTGVSLIDGRVGCCSMFHCGPFKMSLDDGIKIAREWPNSGSSN